MLENFTALSYRIVLSVGNMPYQLCKALLARYPTVEVRLDLCSFSDREIESLYGANSNVITTYRRKEGVSDTERLDKLWLALNGGSRYIDFDIESDLKLIDAMSGEMKRRGISLIVSRHFYGGTPHLSALESVVRESKGLGADLIKVASHVNGASDLLALVRLLEGREDMIVIGMGLKAGRIIPILFGSKFTYACLSREYETAKGQISYKEAEAILSALEKRYGKG